MSNVLSMDLETGSVINTDGRFMVYAVGFHHKSIGYHRIVAETEEELVTGSFIWKAIKQWRDVADELPMIGDEEGDGKLSQQPLIIFAHNGSRFDVIPIMRAILTATGKPLGDMLCSNGKLVS